MHSCVETVCTEGITDQDELLSQEMRTVDQPEQRIQAEPMCKEGTDQTELLCRCRKVGRVGQAEQPCQAEPLCRIEGKVNTEGAPDQAK